MRPAGPPLGPPPASSAGAGLLPLGGAFLFLFLGSESSMSTGDPSYSVVKVKERCVGLLRVIPDMWQETQPQRCSTLSLTASVPSASLLTSTMFYSKILRALS